jgi:hypothetical protein
MITSASQPMKCCRARAGDDAVPKVALDNAIHEHRQRDGSKIVFRLQREDLPSGRLKRLSCGRVDHLVNEQRKRGDARP